jgi:hypothetical protein
MRPSQSVSWKATLIMQRMKSKYKVISFWKQMSENANFAFHARVRVQVNSFLRLIFQKKSAGNLAQ